MNQGESKITNTARRRRLAAKEEEGMKDVEGVEVHTSSEGCMIRERSKGTQRWTGLESLSDTMIATMKRQEKTDHRRLGIDSYRLASELKRVIAEGEKRAAIQSGVASFLNHCERRHKIKSNERRGRMKAV